MSGETIKAWCRKAVEMKTTLELVAPIRGSHGSFAAMAFVVSTHFDRQLIKINSLDTCDFNEAGKVTHLKGYWGPDDVSA